MNPSPDRGKECLPPKKRESRQGSVEHHIPLDEFKPPVPLRGRPSAARGEGGREERALSDPSPHLLHTPPSLPAPAPCLPLSLPWHLSYSPSVSLPLFPGQVAERRGSGSPAWRDDPLSSPLPHSSSRWLRGDTSLSLPPPSSSSPSASSFKTPFPADSREMWPYVNSGRRDYSSSLFSPSYLFSPHSLYPQDPSLVEARHRYLGKRPNGLEGPGSRTVPASRPLLTGEYVNDGSRTRVDFGPHSSHTNGGRRHQEDGTSRVHHGGTYLSDSQTQEDPEPHSSLQDRLGLVKTGSHLLSTSPHPLVPDPRAGRGGPLDPMGATPAEAHIYYSLGSGCHPSPQPPYPPYSPSGTPLYNLHREPGPRPHNVRNSPHSPLGPNNSHDRSHRDRDRDQERERERVVLRDKDRGKDKEKHLQQDKDQERERERRRDRGRESSPSSFHASPPALRPSPPAALLPHFTKGSLIELASGRLKRVEELRTDDFLRSADSSSEFHLSSCTVLLISPGGAQGFSHLQVHLTDRNTQELLKVLAEYPFFVQDRGWSSCCPQRTTQLYGLPCRQLTEGDVCLALTPKPYGQSHRTHARAGPRAHRAPPPARAAGESGGGSHREEMMPPPPPPPPLPHHPPPAAPAPPRTLAADPPALERPRPRKRRWSAPDALPSTGTDVLDLPHGSKLMKWQ